MSGTRLLALDVDGTLVTSGNRVSDATREALVRVRDAGVEIAICTGRRYRTTFVAIDALGLPAAAVCLGGALVKERDGATLDARALTPAEFRAIAGRVRAHGLVAVAQRDSHAGGGADFLIDGSLPWDSNSRAYFLHNEAHAEWRAELAAEERDDVLVVGAFGEPEPLHALADAIAAEGEGRFTARVMPGPAFEGGHYCEILPSEVCKWRGLSALAARRGVSPDQICAVGDGVNDLSMVEAAGLGVAMGNANARLLEVADWVTGRHDEDGLVAVAERILSGP